MVPHDSWADIDNKFFTSVAALKSKGIWVVGMTRRETSIANWLTVLAPEGGLSRRRSSLSRNTDSKD